MSIPLSVNEIICSARPPWDFLGPSAKQHGFAAIGVAPAVRLPTEVTERYREWIEAGSHANMSYLARHESQRFNVRDPRILTDADAVIVAALPYGPGALETGFWKYVAAHARGRDYHATLRERLENLAKTVTARFPGSRHRVFVDTAPVMERTWALLAGVGHLGRNGGVIVSGIGCRVALGEIVLSGVPKPRRCDPPPTPFDLCEDCDLCLAACPTGALKKTALVDASRCLSYWSIEQSKLALPEYIAAEMTQIFGCDQCTSVCPHNQISAASRLELPPETRPVSLDELIAMDYKAVCELIAETPLERTGAEAIIRNAKAVRRNISGCRNQRSE